MLSNKQISLDLRLDFKLETVFAILVAIEIVLLLIDVLMSCCGFIEHGKLSVLFDITLEANIPTWFSSTQAVVTGLVALILARSRKQTAQRKQAIAWYLVGAFFIYLGIDDAAQIHERVSTFINDTMSKESEGLIASILKYFPSYHWQIFFLPVFVIVGVYMMFTLYGELRQHQALLVFIIAMACYAVAVALDYIDGVSAYYNFILSHIQISFDELEHISRAIEEFLEMLGTTFFMMSFLLILSRPAEPKPD